MNIERREQLPDLMRELNLPLIVAEVGVAEGAHAELLLKNGVEELYLIDRWEQNTLDRWDSSKESEWHHDNYNQVLDRTYLHQDKVHILKGNSVDMVFSIPDNTLGMVYIDADHSYEGCL